MEFKTIEEAVESIDFESVAAAMRVLGWKVLTERNSLEMCYPTAAELRKDLLSLYKQVEMLPLSTDPTELRGEAHSGAWRIIKKKYDDSSAVIVNFTISKSVILEKDS